MSEITTGRIYGLSYMSSKKGKKGAPPELIIKIAADCWEEINSLVQMGRFDSDSIEKYIGRPCSLTWEEPFLPLEPRGNLFGIDGCGYVVEVGDEVRVCFPLLPGSQNHVSLTLYLLLAAAGLKMPVDFEDKIGLSQFYWINTGCRHDMHGHSAGGYIFPIFFRWLLTKGEEGGRLPSVEAVLEEAFLALRGFKDARERREIRKLYRYSFRAIVERDGRFFLHCPGNACDLSIYPENLQSTDWCEFSCHNLDSAQQQITLLSGLAALSDMALKEMG